MYVVDLDGKLVVSLGGPRCRLNCRHCYIFAGGFVFLPPTSPRKLVDEIARLDPQPKAVYLSGDIEPFLAADEALEFLQAASETLNVHLMFTTRLALDETTVSALDGIRAMQGTRDRLLIGSVSIPALESYDRIERPALVPSPSSRLDLVRRLSRRGIPVMVSIRPLLPESLVPMSEYRLLLAAIRDADAVCALSSPLFFDRSGVIERRLGLSNLPALASGDMEFLDQPVKWLEHLDADRARMLSTIGDSLGIPVFLRSMPALEQLATRWDPDRFRLSGALVAPSDQAEAVGRLGLLVESAPNDAEF